MEQQNKYLVCVRCFTFNHAKYIEDTMNGFTMQQTTFPFVCVIVDDDSQDGEPEVIKNYLAEHFQIPYRNEETEYAHIICAHHKTNQYCDFVVLLLKYNHYSIKKSKMTYLAEWMKGTKYHALCEGDDYWIDFGKLQKQVEYMENNEDCVLSYTNAIVVDKESRIIKRLNHTRYSGDCTKSLITEGNYIVTAGVCYRSKYENEWNDVRAAIPFELLLCDKPLWIMLSTKGSFFFFKDYMIAYRRLEESASHTKDYAKSIRYSNNVRDINLYFNKLYNIGISEARIILDARLHKLLSSSLLNWTAFLKDFISAIMDYPRFLLQKKFWKTFVRALLAKL